MGQCQTLLGDNGDTGRWPGQGQKPHLSRRDSRQVYPFLILYSKDLLKVSKLLESLSEALESLVLQASHLENGYPTTAMVHLEKTGTGAGVFQRWVLGPLWA